MNASPFPPGRAGGRGFGLALTLVAALIAGAAEAAGPGRAPVPPARPAALASTLAAAPAPATVAEPALPAAALRPPRLRPSRLGPFAGFEALRRDPPAFSTRFASRADPVSVRPLAAPGEAAPESFGALARRAPHMDAPGKSLAMASAPVPVLTAAGPLAGAWRAGAEALGAGRYADAAERFRALAERRPDLARPRLALARALALAGDCLGARAALAAGGTAAARRAPLLAAEAEGDVARRCADAADWTAALSMRLGLPERDVRLPDTLPEIGFGRAQVAMSASDAAWGDVGVALARAARPRAGLRLDLTGRGAVLFADRAAGAAPVRALAEAALVAAAEDADGAERRAGVDAALDLGPGTQVGRGRVWTRYAPGGPGAAWVELSTGLESRAEEGAAPSTRVEMRAAAARGLGHVRHMRGGARYEMQAELGHALPAAGEGARAAWAGLAFRREGAAPLGGAALATRGEIFATLDASREPGRGWRPAALRAGARLAGTGPDAGPPAWGGVAAGLELAVVRELGATRGAAVELALTRGF
ncbi:MAG: hypothetical protein VYD87_09825 [Pseudomonadota bacterium]|nr:hypothetical protein [Pseudomonadota bacterium]